MSVLDIAMACTGCTGLTQLELRESYNQAVVSVEVTCASHTLEIGDSVDVEIGDPVPMEIGVPTNWYPVMEGGIVRKIITRVPEHDYVITIHDILCRAVDFFIASDNPNTPYTASNMKAEALVLALLNMAGITVANADTTIFTFGTQTPTKINLVSAWNMIELICRITGFTCYALPSGLVEFKERKPFLTASDTTTSHSLITGDDGDILDIEYDRNTEALRNRVVVYGGVGNTIYAQASAVSPYLPAGFYKTLVVAHPLIDNQPAATATAALNLEIFNRLTQTCSLTLKGIPTLRARAIVSVVEGFTGLGSATRWLVYGLSHILNKQAGYRTQVTLVR